MCCCCFCVVGSSNSSSNCERMLQHSLSVLFNSHCNDLVALNCVFFFTIRLHNFSYYHYHCYYQLYSRALSAASHVGGKMTSVIVTTSRKCLFWRKQAWVRGNMSEVDLLTSPVTRSCTFLQLRSTTTLTKQTNKKTKKACFLMENL